MPIWDITEEPAQNIKGALRSGIVLGKAEPQPKILRFHPYLCPTTSFSPVCSFSSIFTPTLSA